ncbi:MAG TPA: FGGY family carbohydrate kinase [Acidimicrobiales bacterium]|nr:FGGY family carbohydrate kinase [Acidimicrobiales bacterium]
MADQETQLLVGIDVGTTLTKAAVVSSDGRELAWGQSPTPWRAVATGAECDPAHLMEAVLAALAGALEHTPPGRVAGLGVTSMAETVVYLGADGSPVAPCIAWHDTRGGAEADDLDRVFGWAAFSERTGLKPSRFSTLVKLAWLERHEGIRPRRALCIADWLVHSLGGEALCEASLASRTGALSLASRSWWAEGLEWAGAAPDLLAPVVQAGQRAGTVPAGGPLGTPTLARLAGAAVSSAGHDHLCAAAGAGATGPAQVLNSCGTAEALVRASPPLNGPSVAVALGAGLSVGWHTVPGRYALLAGHSLGLLLDRVLRLVGISGRGAVEVLDGSALSVEPGLLRVVQGGPYDEPSIVGLHAEVSPAALWSAALDAVTANAPRTIRAMDAVAGPADELVLSGGWAHCAGLRRRKAGLLPVVRWPAVVEAGARGAALFGGMAAGIFSGPSDFPLPADQPWGA